MGKLMKRLNSVRVKLIAVPLVLLFIAILALAFSTYRMVEDKMITQMQDFGLDLAVQARQRLIEGHEALAVIEKTLEQKILGVARTVIANQELLSNEYLTQLATDMEVNAIHWYNDRYTITHSAFEIDLGWVAPTTNPVVQFGRSGQTEWAEEIRQAEGNENFYKYGYVRGRQGEIVQVGILANAIQALTEQFSDQTLVDQLASDEKVVFAAIISKDRVNTAHSNRERIGVTLNDIGTITAAQNGETYAAEYYYAAEDVTVYDILLPLHIDGEHVGAVNIGLAMDDVYTALRDILTQIVIIGTAAFIILGALLVSISLNIVNSLHANREHLRHMAAGDFTRQIPERYLNKSDEFGEMAQALSNTQTAIRNILHEVAKAALDVAGTSQELSASTEETSASIEEIASTSNQFASTVEQMNNNSQAIAGSAHQILQATHAGNEGVSKATSSTEELKGLMHQVAITVETLGQQSHQISEIVDVITSIAEQTNLLALNAAIEAARAGEHGRGFAVVADEVRNLAEQSATSATRITDLIRGIQEETQNTISGIDQGVKQAEQNAEIVSETGTLMARIMDAINGIMAQIEELTLGLKEINTGSHEMAATTEEQSASVDSIAQSAQTLSNMSERLQELVSRFKLEKDN